MYSRFESYLGFDLIQADEIKFRTTIQSCCLSCQYHACWCAGDFWSQCISRHDIEPQSRNNPFPASEKLIISCVFSLVVWTMSWKPTSLTTPMKNHTKGENITTLVDNITVIVINILIVIILFIIMIVIIEYIFNIYIFSYFSTLKWHWWLKSFLVEDIYSFVCHT